MNKNNDVTIIQLDEPRELRFGFKALKKLEALGVDMNGLESDSGFKIEDIEKIIYCGLLYDFRQKNETLKLEDMEDLLDQAPSFQEIVNKMQEAFSKSFGGFVEGNDQPGKQNRPESTTGKKA